MSTKHNTEQALDFDEWMTLAQDDPETFEIRRRERIDALIAQAPPSQRRRLQGLQWQIDQTRKLAGGPMASCIAISNMMWDSLYKLNKQQHDLLSMTPGQGAAPKHTPAATVLAFPARQS